MCMVLMELYLVAGIYCSLENSFCTHRYFTPVPVLRNVRVLCGTHDRNRYHLVNVTAYLNNDTGMPQSLAVPDLKNSVVDSNTLNLDPDSDLCPQI